MMKVFLIGLETLIFLCIKFFDFRFTDLLHRYFMQYKSLFTLCLCFVFFVFPAMATEVILEGDIQDVAEPFTVQIEGKAVTKKKKAKAISETFEGKYAKPFVIVAQTIEPGTMQNLQWHSMQSLLGQHSEIPIIVVNGAEPGPILTLTAAIHGDELNGIETIRQVMHGLDPKKLKGVVVGLPVINLEGFWCKERYIGDRKDLNRYFPGNPKGSYPARVADLVFTNIIKHSDIVVDLHTGSFYRENLPQLRVDLNVDEMPKLATGFGALTALHSVAPPGSLRGAATAAGIPAVVMELGGPLSLETETVKVGAKSLRTFLEFVGMINKKTFWPNPQPVFYASQWLRAEAGGILINKVELGAGIEKGDVLAEISNPFTNAIYTVISPMKGTILGRAQNQFVSPGFALFHIGHQKSVEEIGKDVIQEVVEEEIQDEVVVEELAEIGPTEKAVKEEKK